MPMVPLWLDEGLAEYFEVPAADREHGNPHAKYIKIGAHLGQVPLLEDLEQIRDLSEMTRSRYRAAWAWVHFMLHGPPAVGEPPAVSTHSNGSTGGPVQLVASPWRPPST